MLNLKSCQFKYNNKDNNNKLVIVITFNCVDAEIWPSGIPKNSHQSCIIKGLNETCKTEQH